MFNKIAVICTGNICRSPMGEALLRVRAPALKVISAGTGAMVGWGADPKSIELMHEKGVDIESHRAQQLSRNILADMDLVLTLDQTHSDWINARYPEYRGKVHKILKWKGNIDVPDPYKLPREAFVEAYDMIDGGVDAWLKKLL